MNADQPPGLLIRGATLFAPEPRGRCDILIVGGQVARVAPRIPPAPELLDVALVEAEGLLALPGLVDGHVHILGGGGEGGPATRAPELRAAALAHAGVTTAVGLLGFDGLTRTVVGLLAHARSLKADGLDARVYTGAYALPLQTITDNVAHDVVLIEEVIGVGEIAISDHRGSSPTPHELARIGAEAHIAGVLAGKAGLLHLHVGEAKSGLQPVHELLRTSDLPAGAVFPTHVNRSIDLLEDAARLAKKGVPIDLTATVAPDCDEPGAIPPEAALPQLLHAGVPLHQITCTSDGNGSMPVFGPDGHLQSIGLGPVALLWERVRRAVLGRMVPLPVALATVTSNPARRLRLAGKGTIAAGSDADILLCDERMRIHAVYARGRAVLSEGRVQIADPFFSVP